MGGWLPGWNIIPSEAVPYNMPPDKTTPPNGY